MGSCDVRAGAARPCVAAGRGEGVIEQRRDVVEGGETEQRRVMD